MLTKVSLRNGHGQQLEEYDPDNASKELGN
jgi:hypothetical protein